MEVIFWRLGGLTDTPTEARGSRGLLTRTQLRRSKSANALEERKHVKDNQVYLSRAENPCTFPQQQSNAI